MEHWIRLGSDWSVAYIAAHRRESIGDVDANIEYVSHSQLLQFREVISHVLGANQQPLCSRANCLGGGEVQTEPQPCLALLV